MWKRKTRIIPSRSRLWKVRVGLHAGIKNFKGHSDVHQIGVNPSKGKHELTVVDEFGVSQTIRFEIIRK